MAAPLTDIIPSVAITGRVQSEKMILHRTSIAIRLVAAGVLIVAAVLKQRAGPIEGFGLTAHEFLITFELGFALMLLTGVAGRWTATLGAAVFLLFAIVAASKLWSGAASCGCFGRARVPPALTMSIDLLLTCGFLFVRHSEASMLSIRRRQAIFAAGACLLAGHFATALVVAPNDPRLAEIGDTDGNTVYLRPEQWVGRPLPILSMIDGGSVLERGRWVVLIYQEGCATCEAALPRYRAAMPIGNPSQPRCALIDLKSHGPLDTYWASFSAAMQDKHVWFAATPIVAIVVDGTVVYTAAGDDAVDPIHALHAVSEHLTVGR